jgi:hypothetical protein
VKPCKEWLSFPNPNPRLYRHGVNFPVAQTKFVCVLSLHLSSFDLNAKGI